MGEKGDQEWVKMWGADVKVVNPGNLMPDDMLKSCITTTQKVSWREREREAAFERARERGGWTELERIFRMLVPIMSETGGEHMPGRRRRDFGGSRWVVESAAGPLVSL